MIKPNATIEDAYKHTLIELVEHHKKYCEGESCTIQLILLRDIGEKAGVKFSDKEKELFL